MIAVPEISKTMGPDELREKLARALQSIATLHDDIGKLPLSISAQRNVPGIESICEFYRKAEGLIAELAADDIPF